MKRKNQSYAKPKAHSPYCDQVACKLAKVRLRPTGKGYELKCPQCGKRFQRAPERLSDADYQWIINNSDTTNAGGEPKRPTPKSKAPKKFLFLTDSEEDPPDSLGLPKVLLPYDEKAMIEEAISFFNGICSTMTNYKLSFPTLTKTKLHIRHLEAVVRLLKEVLKGGTQMKKNATSTIKLYARLNSDDRDVVEIWTKHTPSVRRYLWFVVSVDFLAAIGLPDEAIGRLEEGEAVKLHITAEEDSEDEA